MSFHVPSDIPDLQSLHLETRGSFRPSSPRSRPPLVVRARVKAPRACPSGSLDSCTGADQADGEGCRSARVADFARCELTEA